MTYDQALGALLGLAVGDALGTTLEFTRPSPLEPFPRKETGPLTEIVGGGPFSVEPGQTTDDTQMATALAMSLMENQGYNPSDVARRYQHWRTHAFDIGGQTSGGLSRIRATPEGEEYRAGYLYWASTGRSAAGNGSLMRTAPIGVVYYDDFPQLVRVSVLDSMMTHADPRCLFACAAYNAGIAFAVRGSGSEEKPVPKRVLFAAARAIEDARAYVLETFPDYYTKTELNDAASHLYDDLMAALDDDPGLLTGSGSHRLAIPDGLGGARRPPSLHGSSGFVRTAFRYAFWALCHATDYREAIIDVVNRGGDADTNGAIVGGLLGAYFGAEGIPETWRTTVLTAMEGKPTSPWWQVYHPRFFLTLVGLSTVLPDLNAVEDTVRSWQTVLSTATLLDENPASAASALWVHDESSFKDPTEEEADQVGEERD